MVYTITLNPALDRNIWIEKLRYDESNRIRQEKRYAAGKGIDVSRVLTTLGVRNQALGFAGGYHGEELEGRLINEGISCSFIRIAGETRTNIIIYDEERETQTIFSARGPEVQSNELMGIIRQVENLENPEILVISGSLPRGLHPEIYCRLMEIGRNKGARVLLDTDGEALKAGIRTSPDLIKPNIHELSRLAGLELHDTGKIIDTALEICRQGTGTVLVSMGAKGILMVRENERYLAVPPPVKVLNTIGAGDSSVAGFVYGMVTGKTLAESLVHAVAAGTATTLLPGPALCTEVDFFKISGKVRLYRENEIADALKD
jgi:6-phosphofructokinase 2